MEFDLDSLEVVHDPGDERFEAVVDGHVAELVYRRRADVLVLAHTGVPEPIEGHGVAALLARTALDYAREHHLRVIPSCPYVAAYLEDHPEYADLVA